MTIHNGELIHKKLEQIFSEGFQNSSSSVIELEPYIKEIAIHFTDLAQRIIDQTELFPSVKIVAGYSRSNLRVFIGKQDFCFPNTLLIYFNAYYFEFFVDFLATQLFPKSISFKEMFSKYLKNCVDRNTSNDLYMFYASSCSNRKYSSDELKRLFHLASLGIYFVMFHEYSHLYTDLLQSTIKLTHNKNFLQQVDSLTQSQLEEACCDHNAIKLIHDLEIARTLECSQEDALLMSFLALPIYRLYESLVHSVIDRFNGDSISESLSQIHYDMKNRITPYIMMLKMSQNTGWFSKDLDIGMLFSKAGDYVIKFMQEQSSYYQNLPQDIDAWNNVPNKDNSFYSDCSESKDRAWIYYNS